MKLIWLFFRLIPSGAKMVYGFELALNIVDSWSILNISSREGVRKMAETEPHDFDLKQFVQNALRCKGSALGLIVFFAMVGLPFTIFGYGVYQAYGFWDLRTNGVSVKATIVRIEVERMGSSMALHHYPIIRYEVDSGAMIESRAAVVKQGRHRVGQVVDAFYDAENPERVMLDNLKHHMTGYLIIVGFGAFLSVFVIVTLRTIFNEST